MTDRLIRWNVFGDPADQIRQRYRYTVVIINDKREIERISQRFFDQMAPVNDLNEILDEPIPKSKGLRWHVFSFSSDVETIKKPREIYDNSMQFKRERNLSEKNRHFHL